MKQLPTSAVRRQWKRSLVLGESHASSHTLVRSVHSKSAMADLFADQTLDAIQHLGEGQARCEFCQGDYSVPLEVVCGDCERPLCPLCATRLRRTYRCPECTPTARIGVRDPG